MLNPCFGKSLGTQGTLYLAVLGCTGLYWAVMNCTVSVVQVVQVVKGVHVVHVVHIIWMVQNGPGGPCDLGGPGGPDGQGIQVDNMIWVVRFVRVNRVPG